MNVRVSPSMRCSYDSTENALRIVTQEPIADDRAAGEKDGKPQLEIVIYAMKARFRQGFSISNDSDY